MDYVKIKERTYFKKLIVFILGIVIGWIFFLMVLQIVAPSAFLDGSGELTDFCSTLSLILSLVIMVLYSIVSEYNYLKKLELTCESLLSNISVYKKRESDLLKKAWKIIAKFLGHEGDIQKTVAKVRSQMTKTNHNIEEISDVQDIKLVIENYPDLKSDAHIMKILSQVEESQNIILEGKLVYNQYITFYNTAIVSFPALLFIGIWKLKKLNLYVDDVNEFSIE